MNLLDLIGIGDAGATMIPATSPSTNPLMVSHAMQLKESGANRNEIWKQTGEGYGQPAQFTSEGNLQWELDDSKAKLKSRSLMQMLEEYQGIRKTKLKDLLSHPSLYEAIPSVSDLPVEYTKFNNDSIKGGLTSDLSKMVLGEHPAFMFTKDPNEYDAVSSENTSEKELDRIISRRKGVPDGYMDGLELLLHESQHIPQTDMKGSFVDFNRPKAFRPELEYNRYKNSPGEVEARATSQRISLPMKERIKRPIWYDYE